MVFLLSILEATTVDTDDYKALQGKWYNNIKALKNLRFWPKFTNHV